MPPAARISDMHTCPMVNPGPVPHVGGPEISGSPDVITGYLPQGRVGDSLVCVPAIDKIAAGSATVLVNNMPAARLGDPTAHGGRIVAGCPTVLIGDTGQGSTLVGAAKNGTPFCEECEKAKQALAKELGEVPTPNHPPAGSANTLTQQGKEILAAIKKKVDEIVPPEKREEFKKLIKTLKPVAEQLKAKGEDSQSVANWAVTARKVIANHYGAELDTHGDLLKFVYDRNKAKFGDGLGPGVDFLMSDKGKKYRDLIDAAAEGRFKDQLQSIRGDIVDDLTAKVIDDPRTRELIRMAAEGKFKDLKGELAGDLASKFTDNEQLKELAKAAAKGEFKEKLKEISGDLASDFAGQYTDNEHLKALAKAAAQGNLKETFANVKGDLASDLAGQFTADENVKALAKAAADGKLEEGIKGVLGTEIEKAVGQFTDNEKLKALASSVVHGNTQEVFQQLKGGLAADAVAALGGNEKVSAIVKAAVEQQLPQTLGGMSADAVNKLMSGMMSNPDAAKVLGPVVEYLREQVSAKVMEEAMRLLPAAVGGGG
jgi:uncharacterized Zn-binding protein involved in type VI secretion